MRSLIISALLLLALLLPATVMAYEVIEVGNIYYIIDGNKASVTRGENPYTGNVTIPSTVTHSGNTYPVTSIAGFAFRGYADLTGVTIPNSVTSIGGLAFAECTGLTSVTFPDSLTTISEQAFQGCTGLTSVSIPKLVTSIGNAVFRECSGLSRITVDKDNTQYDSRDSCNAIIETASNTLIMGCKSSIIPNSVTSIGASAFAVCRGLASVSIPNSVTSIGNGAFYYCSGLTSVTIPESVTTIGEGAFYGSGLTSVTIPESVTTIGVGAFQNCKSLTSATIGNSVTSIAREVFFGCNALASVTIGNSVTSIGDGAFYACQGLTGVTFPPSVTTIGYQAFYGCSGLTNLDILNSVASIGEMAFGKCSGLTTLNIGNSLTSIGPRAFSYCSGLESITVDSGNPKYDSRDSCNAIIETACDTLIAGCMNTVIPNSVIAIGDHAFEGCSGLTGLDIPASVTFIGESAFINCSSLDSVDIPNSVTVISIGAFHGCSGMTSLDIPNSVTTIGAFAFADCSSLTDVTIPNSVTRINGGTFQDCSGLTSVTIPNTVTVIDSYAFRGCSSLTDVAIPSTVTTIGESAFQRCSSLASVTIHNTVTTIGDWAFVECSSLADVYCYIIYPSAISMGNQVFDLLDSDFSGRTLYVPYGTVEAYQADQRWYPYFEQIEEALLPGYLRGDVNGDGEVNVADINSLIDIILTGGGHTVAADVNGDGEYTIADINAIIDIIMGGDVPAPDEHGYVDLGLPSGTLWATCNIGASTPEEYGDYFAWGETEPKEEYTWETYKWCDGSYKTLTKYNTDTLFGEIDNRRELMLADDAAYVNWGALWRMPTEAQMMELIQNCTWQWTTRNDVSGCLVTGPNGNTMFMPAAGFRSGSSLNNEGVEGDYWSRILPSVAPFYANGLSCDSRGVYWLYGTHCSGYTVRAVRIVKKKPLDSISLNLPSVVIGETVNDRIKYQLKTVVKEEKRD